MSIISITPYYTGQVNQLITRWKLVCTDALAQVTTANFLNTSNLMGYKPSPNDIFDVIYLYTGSISQLGTGTYTECTPTIAYSQGVATYTLNQIPQSGVSPSVANDLVTFSNTSGGLQDSGVQIANVQLSALTNPDAISDLIWHDVVCGQAALAAAGKVNIQISSAAKQYAVRNVIVNYGASGLSGNSGNRLLAITDGTTVYNNAGITAALLGTPINTVWGGTGNPLAGTVALDTPTAAGANLYAQYSGGSADYNAGSVTISVLVQRIA